MTLIAIVRISTRPLVNFQTTRSPKLVEEVWVTGQKYVLDRALLCGILKDHEYMGRQVTRK